jgi:hypothetical protein
MEPFKIKGNQRVEKYIMEIACGNSCSAKSFNLVLRIQVLIMILLEDYKGRGREGGKERSCFHCV